MRSRASELKRDFARIKGADEWGVKVFAVKSAVRPIGKIQSGKDYLKAKAALLPKRRPATIASTELAEFDEALKQVAAETAAIGSVSSGQRGLTYQKSLLVKRTDREKLESILKKFADDWAEVLLDDCFQGILPFVRDERADRVDHVRGAKSAGDREQRIVWDRTPQPGRCPWPGQPGSRGRR